MSTTDRDCVKQCLNGHPEAFLNLVERYHPALLSFLTGKLGNWEQAEEAAQETLVRAFFGLKQLNQPESFFSWLLGIGQRVVQEEWRRIQRQRNSTEISVEHHGRSELLGDMDLKRAITELPALYREVILLRYYSGKSCAEVAEQLGVSVGTITMRLSRAHRKLREILDCKSENWR